MVTWNRLGLFDIFSPLLVCMNQEKSGNPGAATLSPIALFKVTFMAFCNQGKQEVAQALPSERAHRAPAEKRRSACTYGRNSSDISFRLQKRQTRLLAKDLTIWLRRGGAVSYDPGEPCDISCRHFN
jgi:hypothetical protein